MVKTRLSKQECIDRLMAGNYKINQINESFAEVSVEDNTFHFWIGPESRKTGSDWAQFIKKQDSMSLTLSEGEKNKIVSDLSQLSKVEAFKEEALVKQLPQPLITSDKLFKALTDSLKLDAFLDELYNDFKDTDEVIASRADSLSYLLQEPIFEALGLDQLDTDKEVEAYLSMVRSVKNRIDTPEEGARHLLNLWATSIEKHKNPARKSS